MQSQGEYFAPEFRSEGFHCPHCGVYAAQSWHPICIPHTDWHFGNEIDTYKKINNDDQAVLSICAYCKQCSYWINQNLVFPAQSTAPQAHPDMQEDIKAFYNEARQIASASPRSAAVLLRIVAEQLCDVLEAKGKNLYDKILHLQKEGGLPEKVIQSLQIVRIHGNQNAHDAQIDLTDKDDGNVVNKLFWLVNYIVKKCKTEPKEIDQMLGQLPDNKKIEVESQENED